MAKKYEPLTIFLKNSQQNVIKLTFKEIENIIHSKLPNSASDYDEWWDNGVIEGRHSYGWLDANYIKIELERCLEYVVFEKIS
ncbi:MAG: hypothetical protein J0L55_15355 [Caulobacterales bacterium]|nr:hypothetical protein [Caulobacterales bacterium]